MSLSPLPTLPTLFTAHAAVEEYRQWRCGAAAPPAAVSLSAIDTFLMDRVSAYAPIPPYVIDLAADATDGDSVAFWVGTGLPVIVPHVSWNPAPAPDWRPLLRAWAARRTTPDEPEGIARHPTFVEMSLATMGDWQAITTDIPRGIPLLVILAETAETADHTGAHLDLLRRCAPHATILLLPLGAIGTGPVLAQTLCACPPGGSQQVTALRELAPFFATSQLGLVAPASDATIPTILERIEGLVAGNFQFLTLVQEAIRAAQDAHADDSANDDRAGLHAIVAEKNEYVRSLEDRLRYIEGTLLPWKDSVIAELERGMRSLDASKALRAERLARRLLRR
jgi:hypothetical protein